MISKESFSANVSHETIQRLEAFEALLLKWNPRINLISKSDTDRVWQRHILDSAQIFDHVDQPVTTWLDLGSGGGFPGIVCAILALENRSSVNFHLVESDTRKAIFLRQAASDLSLPVLVHAMRIEAFGGGAVDVITARALAALPELLDLSQKHIGPDTQLLFPKGRKAETELVQASLSWDMKVQRIPSLTDSEATILRLSGVTRRP